MTAAPAAAPVSGQGSHMHLPRINSFLPNDPVPDAEHPYQALISQIEKRTIDGVEGLVVPMSTFASGMHLEVVHDQLVWSEYSREIVRKMVKLAVGRDQVINHSEDTDDIVGRILESRAIEDEELDQTRRFQIAHIFSPKVGRQLMRGQLRELSDQYWAIYDFETDANGKMINVRVVDVTFDHTSFVTRGAMSVGDGVGVGDISMKKIAKKLQSKCEPLVIRGLTFATGEFNPEEAVAWAKDHGFGGDVHLGSAEKPALELHINQPSQFIENGVGKQITFITRDLADGVQAVMGRLKPEFHQEETAKQDPCDPSAPDYLECRKSRAANGDLPMDQPPGNPSAPDPVLQKQMADLQLQMKAAQEATATANAAREAAEKQAKDLQVAEELRQQTDLLAKIASSGSVFPDAVLKTMNIEQLTALEADVTAKKLEADKKAAETAALQKAQGHNPFLLGDDPVSEGVPGSSAPGPAGSGVSELKYDPRTRSLVLNGHPIPAWESSISEIGDEDFLPNAVGRALMMDPKRKIGRGLAKYIREDDELQRVLLQDRAAATAAGGGF